KTSYEWIYNWVRDPKHYSPATYMPNLRLTDAQVADVATYLTSLKGPSGDAPKATPDQAAVDQVILDYYKAVMPFEEAKAAIAKLDPEQKQVALGQRDIQPAGAMPPRSARYDYLVSGRTLVHRRNCVGCHIIEADGGDFVKLVADPSLGPPMLTPEGARVQHDWLYAFLRGPITIRPWLEVRMPTFGLDDQNVNRVINYSGSISNNMV